MSKIEISRRLMLSAPAIIGGAAALGALPIPQAEAKAPLRGTQAPYFYRFKHGKMECTAVSDGPLPLGDPTGAFLGVPKEQVSQMLTNSFLDTKNVVLEQNALVVNTGDRLVLFETGMGASQMFGKTTGRLVKSLLEAGIDPSRIDAVVCSHAHIAHIGGLVNAKGKKLFKNAKVYLSQADFDFWTDEKDPKKNKDFVAHARKNLLPYRDQMVFFKDGQEFLPGIAAIAAPGHTVGHTVFMLTSEGQQMCAIGDLTHHQVLLLERPTMEFAYDTDPKQSAQTRVKLLTMLADKKIPMMSYHFPWPGIGHVAKSGDGFRFFATPMKMLL